MFKLSDILINEDLNRVISLMDMGVVPDLRIDQGTPNHDKDLLSHTIEVVRNVPVDPIMKVAAFFHDCGKPFTKEWSDEKNRATYLGHDEVGAELTMEYMGMLGVDFRSASTVSTLVKFHMRPLNHFNNPFGSKGLRRLVRKVEEGGATMDQLLALNKADILAHSKEVIERNLPMHQELTRKIESLRAA